jgi:hypothetical protein
MKSQVFCLKGYFLEANSLSEIINIIHEEQCDFRVLQFDVGRRANKPSFLKIEVLAEKNNRFEHISERLLLLGMYEEKVTEAIFKAAPDDSFAPDSFYPASSADIEVYCDGSWHAVLNVGNDNVIVKTHDGMMGKVLKEIKKDDLILCGDTGVRQKVARQSNKVITDFSYSQTRAAAAVEIAALLRKNRRENIPNVFLVGVMAIRAGGSDALTKLIENGYIQGILGDNLMAVVDIERSFFNTAMGYCLTDQGRSTEVDTSLLGNMVRAVNRIYGYGSIKKAVEVGALNSGLMHAIIKNNIAFSLKGSISDINPLPETLMDNAKAQYCYRYILEDAGALVLCASFQNALGAVRLASGSTQVFHVNSDPTALVRLATTAPTSVVSIVSDAGFFLAELVRILEL